MARRDYRNDFVSVTEALNVLRKIGLEYWFKNNTAKFCNDKSKRGREIGTQVHNLIEKYINQEALKIDTQYPDEVKNALGSFFLFKKEHPEIKLKFSEIAGTSKKHEFNFTADCTAEDENGELVADWKTGECKEEDKPKIYDESLYQVSAYTYALNELQGKDIKRAIVVSFAKDKVAYNIAYLSEVDVREYFEIAFLSALTIAKFQKRKKLEAKLKKGGK